MFAVYDDDDDDAAVVATKCTLRNGLYFIGPRSCIIMFIPGKGTGSR
jgi:hypothetical protein